MALADFRNSIITQDKFSATFRKFDQGVQTSARGIDKLGAAISGGGAGMLFGAVAGAAGVAAIGKTIWSLGELGAQSLTTKASFENLMSAVGQSPALLDRLSAAAGGTITEMTLMQQANSALAGTTGQLSQEMAAALPKLLEAGRAAAKLNPAYGDAAFMFQSLVSGVKRGTPMLIDNTGITLKIGEATEAYADSIGKSVTELTAQERSIAILRATLEGADTLINQAGTSAQNYASDMQRAKIATEELKTALGELVAPATASMASNLATGIRGLTASLQGDAIAKASVDVAYFTNELRNLEGQTRDTAFGQDLLAKQTDKARAALGEAMAELQALQAPLQNADRLTMEYSQAATTAAGTTRQLGNSAAIAAVQVRQLRDSLSEARFASQTLSGGGLGADRDRQAAWGIATSATAAPLNESLALLSDYNRKLDALNANRANMTKFQYDREKAALLANLQDSLGAYEKYAKDVGATMSDMESDIKSKIGSALTPTFDLSGLTGGVLGGMGGDTFDEAYKRLAAVALRPEELQIHAGDWADTFQKAGLTGLSPEDAQARAKELVEAYNKGLDFSLIDREKIKDSVRQAIKAEELYQSVVDEIYAEMGKPNPKAKGAGEALGKQINEGVLIAAKGGGSAYNNALAEAVSPYVARILAQQAARYEQ